jgi:altronate dehydratase
LVHRALVLEHGCEKTHNDAMRHFLSRGGIDPDKLGWASIQLDGGLERVTAKAIDWFHRSTDAESEPALQAAGLDRLRLGVMAVGTVPEAAATALAELALLVVHAGGTLVVPENTPLLHSGDFLKRLLQSPQLPAPTLSYGQPFTESGLHLMQTPTDHHVETLTGLGATGVEILLAHVTGWPAQGHPLVPFVQVCTSPSAEDFDLNMAGETEPLSALLKLLARVAAREQLPRTFVLGNTDFQMTRGWFGVSL